MVLYVKCAGPLLNRIATVIITIVIAATFGNVLGGLISGLVTRALLAESSGGSIAYSVGNLAPSTVSTIFFVFAVLAFSEITPKWNSALPMKELQSRRPTGIAVLAVFYVIAAALSTVFLPLTLAAPGPSALVTTIYILSSGLIIAGQIALAVGLYFGKKWAWVVTLISASGGISLDLAYFAIYVLQPWPLVLISLVAIIAFLITLVILWYLLILRVRRFFGMVNPALQTPTDTSSNPNSNAYSPKAIH